MFSALASAGAALLVAGISTGIPFPTPGPFVPYTPVTLPSAQIGAYLDRATAQIGESVKMVVSVAGPTGDPVVGTLTVTERAAGKADRLLFSGNADHFYTGPNEDRTLAAPVTQSGTVSLVIVVTPDPGGSVVFGNSKTLSYTVPVPATAAASPAPSAPKSGSSGGSGSSTVGATTPSPSASSASPTPSSSPTPAQTASASEPQNQRALSSSDSQKSTDQTIWIVLIVCLTVLLLAGGAVFVLIRRRA